MGRAGARAAVKAGQGAGSGLELQHRLMLQFKLLISLVIGSVPDWAKNRTLFLRPNAVHLH